MTDERLNTLSAEIDAELDRYVELRIAEYESLGHPATREAAEAQRAKLLALIPAAPRQVVQVEDPETAFPVYVDCTDQ